MLRLLNASSKKLILTNGLRSILGDYFLQGRNDGCCQHQGEVVLVFFRKLESHFQWRSQEDEVLGNDVRKTGGRMKLKPFCAM